MSEVILSGIRATGRLHFGNFIGAVRHFVDFQKPGNQCFYFIADLHTLTTLKDPNELRKNLREIVKDYLAAGLNPENCTIYAQSSIPELSELSLLLSMLQPLGELQNIPTFKELVRRNPDQVSLGLITYPVLMAADILGPRTTLVPVGSDQVPNVELARDLARRFNDRFGDSTFVIPRMMERMDRVPGLDGEKMGKSDAANAIGMDTPPEQIRRLYLSKGQTDPLRIKRTDPGDPHNRCRGIYPIHSLVTEGEFKSLSIARKCIAAEISCVECKNLVADSVIRILAPFQERRRELADKDAYVTEILHEGGKKARVAIAETTSILRDKMGIVVY